MTMVETSRSDLTPGERLSVPHSDSWLLQGQMLAHGFSTIRMPRHALLGMSEDSGTQVAFMAGIPESSTLSGVFVSEKGSVWRTYMEEHRVQVIPSRAFRPGQLKDAVAYAEDIGFPVRVRSVKRDHFGGGYSVVSAPSDLKELMGKLRETYKGSRILVQKHLEGVVLDCLVVEGDVLSALEERDGEVYEVSDDVHPDVRRLAVDAVAALPGLRQARVQIAVEDFQAMRGGSFAMVEEISADAALWARCNAEGADLRLAAKFFQHHLAAQSLPDSPRRPEEVEVRIEFSGTSNASGFLDAASGYAKDRDLDVLRAEVLNNDTASMSLKGRPDVISLLSLNAVRGFDGESAHMVHTQLV